MRNSLIFTTGGARERFDVFAGPVGIADGLAVVGWAFADGEALAISPAEQRIVDILRECTGAPAPPLWKDADGPPWYLVLPPRQGLPGIMVFDRATALHCAIWQITTDDGQKRPELLTDYQWDAGEPPMLTLRTPDGDVTAPLARCRRAGLILTTLTEAYGPIDELRYFPPLPSPGADL